MANCCLGSFARIAVIVVFWWRYLYTCWYRRDLRRRVSRPDAKPLASLLTQVMMVEQVTIRSFLAVLLGFLGSKKTKAETPKASFLPVPSWHPSFSQPLDRVVARISYYLDRRKDFVVFHNGTCVLLDEGLTEKEAGEVSLKVLSDILSFHPDMNPTPMDDGNILVQYNHPALNVVLHDVAQAHWSEIESRHLDGLTPSEVLITPLGPNKFDAFGKQALLGRAYMFLDAQKPEISRIIRRSQ